MEARKLLILPLLALGLLAACLPKPGDPIEYVESEEAVIVQKQTLFPSEEQELDDACRVPEFTLYGNGTLLYREQTNDGYSGPPGGVLRVRLSEEEIVELLESVTDDGFLELAYNQPGPVIENARTTLIYVNTKGAANAARAESLLSGGLPEEDSDYDDAERVLETAQLIDESALEFGTEGVTAFESSGAMLVVKPAEETFSTEPREWQEAIDLGEVAPPGSGVVEVRLEGTDAASISGGTVTQDGRGFSVCVRPLLPFEENFPEFDTP